MSTISQKSPILITEPLILGSWINLNNLSGCSNVKGQCMSIEEKQIAVHPLIDSGDLQKP